MVGGVEKAHGVRRSLEGWVMYPELRKFSRAMFSKIGFMVCLGLESEPLEHVGLSLATDRRLAAERIVNFVAVDTKGGELPQ